MSALRSLPVRALAFSLLFASAAFAGCLTAIPSAEIAPARYEPTPVSDEVRDAVIELKHDHSDAEAHALGSPNMALLGFNALGENNTARGTYGEIEIRGDTAYVAVLGDGGEMPGVLVIDISNRADPRVISFTPVPMTRLADVKADQGGRWVYVGAQAWTVNPASPTFASRIRTPPADALGDATSRAQWTYQNGLQVYDASDPSKLVLVTGFYSNEGCHMVAVKDIGGAKYVFCVGSTINIFRFDTTARTLSQVGTYAPQSPDGVTSVGGNDRSNPQGFYQETRLGARPHDMTVQDDPLTGHPVLVASYWDWGVRVVDIANPAMPREIGAWTGAGAKHFEGNVHTAMLASVDGHRVLVAIPELLSDNPAGVFVLDATDYASLSLMGEWYAEGEPGADGLRFSTHNFQVLDGRVYMAYYHAGVWVLDISNETLLTKPVARGFYMPHANMTTYGPPEGANRPDVWDVVLKDGYIYATDIYSGLYVLHYKPDTLGDAYLTSFA